MSEKNRIWSLWPRMIQFNPPNHVQKTNQKNLHISAGKHPFDTSEVLQVCQLLCLKSQTSEHGTKCSFITSDLRADDVEAISQRRGSQSCNVSDHIGAFQVEPFQLPEILQSCNVAEDLGGVEGELRQLPEILQRLNVTRDLGHCEVEDPQVWQFAEARTQGAGDLLVPIQTDLHHFAALPRWLRDAPDAVEGPTEVVSADRFLSQVLLCLKNSPFLSVSSQKWATATPQQPRQKLSKGWPLCKQVSNWHLPCRASPWVAILWIPASSRPPSAAPLGDR